MVGTLARIRPSSPILPSDSGTLRSERTSTRLPRTSPSESRVPIRSEGLADVADEVDQPVGVAPLVDVPADDLHLVADHLGQSGVEDARGRVGDDVAGHDRRVDVA